jgi:hypothetical protein
MNGIHSLNIAKSKKLKEDQQMVLRMNKNYEVFTDESLQMNIKKYISENPKPSLEELQGIILT